MFENNPFVARSRAGGVFATTPMRAILTSGESREENLSSSSFRYTSTYTER